MFYFVQVSRASFWCEFLLRVSRASVMGLSLNCASSVKLSVLPVRSQDTLTYLLTYAQGVRSIHPAKFTMLSNLMWTLTYSLMLGGVVIKTLALRLSVAGSIPGHNSDRLFLR